jgi:hypothetical protein
MTDLAEQVVVCSNQGLPIEQRIGVEKIPKAIRSEESFEYACFLCDGRVSNCLGYVKPK